MILDLQHADRQTFHPDTFMDACEALFEGRLIIRSNDGSLVRPENREAYTIQIQGVAKGGVEGMYETKEGYAIFMGAVTFFYSLLATEAKLAGRFVDEDAIPFGEGHVDSGAECESREPTQEEIDQLMADLDNFGK